MTSRHDLWTCPECGRSFANANQWHSCITVAVDDHFRGRPPRVRALYDRLLEIIRANGPVTVNSVKTRISFQVRMNFAAVYPRKDRLRLTFVLARSLASPRFTLTETFSPGNHLHELDIRTMEDLDDELRQWLAEAYEVGRQAHLE